MNKLAIFQKKKENLKIVKHHMINTDRVHDVALT